MNVKACTTYTKKELISFSRNVTIRFRPVLWILYAVVIVLNLVGYLIVSSSGDSDPINLCCAVFLALMFAVVFFSPNLTSKKSHLLNSDVFFAFTEDGVDIEHRNVKMAGTETVSYDVFYRVIETKTRLYLMLNKAQGYPVDLTRLEEGTLDDLHYLLNAHVPPKKYIRK